MQSRTGTTARTTLAVSGLALLTALGLAGCTAGSEGGDGGGSAPSSQSVEEACGIVSDEVDSAVAGFEGAAQDDPQVAIDAMRDAASALEQAGSRVTNEEVSALLPDLQNLFTQLGDVVEDVLIDGDVSQADALQGLADDFQGTLTEFQELCTTTAE